MTLYHEIALLLLTTAQPGLPAKRLCQPWIFGDLLIGIAVRPSRINWPWAGESLQLFAENGAPHCDGAVRVARCLAIKLQPRPSPAKKARP